MNKLNITIYSQRLMISPLTINDAPFMFQLLNTDGWIKYIGDRNIGNEDDARSYIIKILSNPTYAYNVIRLKDSPNPVGLVTLLLRDNHEYPDIGFALLPQYLRQGYALESSRALLAEMLKTNNYHTITGITLEENVSSIKTLTQLGLSFKEKYISDDVELCRFSSPVENLKLRNA